MGKKDKDNPYGSWRKGQKYFAQNYVAASKLDERGWEKSYGITSTLDLSWIGKLALYGAAAFVLVYWLVPDAQSRFKQLICYIKGDSNCDETISYCPEGYHSERKCDELVGLPKIGCQVAGFVTGGMSDCVPDSVTPPVTPPYHEPCYDQIGAWECQLQGGYFDSEHCECTGLDQCYEGTNRCVNGHLEECAIRLNYFTGESYRVWVPHYSIPCGGG